MPMSTWLNTDDAVRHIRTMQPKSVLDIGIGFGKWGFLIRGSVEVGAMRIAPKDWLIEVHGVEACSEYLGHWCLFQEEFYNRIYHTDIRDFKFEQRYDMVIAGDIIEHLTKADGMDVMRKIMDNCRSFIFVIPCGPGWLKSNDKWVSKYPHEEHKCEWTPLEIERFAKSFKFKTQTFTAQIHGKTVCTFLGEKR